MILEWYENEYRTRGSYMHSNKYIGNGNNMGCRWTLT